MRFAPIGLLLMLLVILATMLINRPDPAAQLGMMDKPLPTLALSPLIQGKAWDVKQLEGHVTVMNVFASWCVPCAAEMPELVKLARAFPDIKLVGIAWNDDPKTITQWLRKNGNPFHSVWRDKNGDATMALGLKGVPETLIIDRRGHIRYRLAGPVNPALREATIDPLLTQLQREAGTDDRAQ